MTEEEKAYRVEQMREIQKALQEEMLDRRTKARLAHYRKIYDECTAKYESASLVEDPPAFGLRWISAFGKQAFGWTTVPGVSGPMVLGVTYNEETGRWDGESCCDFVKAIASPATGRVPNQPQLKKKLQQVIAERIDYTIRPSGTY